MQNYKKYAVPPAQLIIADVPYNIGNNFYGSNPMWYAGGGTTGMVKASWQRKQPLILTSTSTYMSIFISVRKC